MSVKNVPFDYNPYKDPFGQTYISYLQKVARGDKETDAEVDAPVIVKRDEWGAAPANGELPALERPIQVTLFTQTGTDECFTREECTQFLRNEQKKNMEEDELADIQFNFYIGGDNTIYEGRGWDVKADKESDTDFLKEISIDIAYIGNFDYEVTGRRLSDEMTQTGCLLAKYMSKQGLLHLNYNITTYWEDHIETLRQKPNDYNPLDDDTPLLDGEEEEYKRSMA